MIDSQGRSGPCKRRRRSRVILGDPNVNHVELLFFFFTCFVLFRPWFSRPDKRRGVFFCAFDSTVDEKHYLLAQTNKGDVRLRREGP